MSKIWSGENKLYYLLIPFSLLYSMITWIRRKLYQFGILSSWRAPIPVIVVGNLSVGGNGKTPLVVSLVEQLQSRRYRVGVVSRGYGGKSDSYPLIVDDTTTAIQAGDEPILIYERTGVPFAVAPKRSDAVKALINKYPLDLIITDDGLQHYALQRDIEIVVIDGRRFFGNGWRLPAGPMRESQTRLNDVDFIVINGDIPSNDLLAGRDNFFTMYLKPMKAINLVSKEQQDLSSFPQICAMAGIAHPQRFFDMLKMLNVDLIKTFAFADHQAFSATQLSNLTTDNQILLMTEKDAVKCKSFAQPNWWYLPIDAQINNIFIEMLIKKIDASRKQGDLL